MQRCSYRWDRAGWRGAPPDHYQVRTRDRLDNLFPGKYEMVADDEQEAAIILIDRPDRRSILTPDQNTRMTSWEQRRRLDSLLRGLREWCSLATRMELRREIFQGCIIHCSGSIAYLHPSSCLTRGHLCQFQFEQIFLQVIRKTT